MRFIPLTPPIDPVTVATQNGHSLIAYSAELLASVYGRISQGVIHQDHLLSLRTALLQLHPGEGHELRVVRVRTANKFDEPLLATRKTANTRKVWASAAVMTALRGIFLPTGIKPPFGFPHELGRIAMGLKGNWAGFSLWGEEFELLELIGLEARIEGDEGDVSGIGPSGEEGVHPEFGRGGAGGDVVVPSGIQAGGFERQEGGAFVEHELFPDKPCGGGRQRIVAHDGAVGEETENGLLDGPTPAAGGGLPLPPPRGGDGVMLVTPDQDRQPDVGVNERCHGL